MHNCNAPKADNISERISEPILFYRHNNVFAPDNCNTIQSGESIRNIAFTDDGETLAVSSYHGEVKFFSMDTFLESSYQKLMKEQQQQQQNNDDDNNNDSSENQNLTATGKQQKEDRVKPIFTFCSSNIKSCVMALDFAHGIRKDLCVVGFNTGQICFINVKTKSISQNNQVLPSSATTTFSNSSSVTAAAFSQGNSRYLFIATCNQNSDFYGRGCIHVYRVNDIDGLEDSYENNNNSNSVSEKEEEKSLIQSKKELKLPQNSLYHFEFLTSIRTISTIPGVEAELKFVVGTNDGYVFLCDLIDENFMRNNKNTTATKPSIIRHGLHCRDSDMSSISSVVATVSSQTKKLVIVSCDVHGRAVVCSDVEGNESDLDNKAKFFVCGRHGHVGPLSAACVMHTTGTVAATCGAMDGTLRVHSLIRTNSSNSNLNKSEENSECSCFGVEAAPPLIHTHNSSSKSPCPSVNDAKFCPKNGERILVSAADGDLYLWRNPFNWIARKYAVFIRLYGQNRYGKDAFSIWNVALTVAAFLG